MMEFIDSGKVIMRGAGSRAIPLKGFVAKMMGGIQAGDEFEIHKEGSRLIITFPGKTAVKAPDEGGTF